MVFFQALLLAGYGYALLAERWIAPKWQAMLHAGLLLLALTWLPLQVGGLGSAEATASPERWLLGTLLATVALPFFVLAAHAPLLQHWYVRATGADPYRFYAASNLGSFTGLLAYPLLVEPTLRLSAQLFWWSVGFGLLVLLVLACAWAMRCLSTNVAPLAQTPAPCLRQCARWVALAAIPSALMLAVTGYITTDLGSFPLLWVIPLALYLLSFVVAFHRPRAPLYMALPALIGVSMLLLAMFSLGNTGLWLMALHLGVFMLVATACHSALSASKPAADRLGGFYVCLSLGGVLGGACVALLAPLVFNNIYEYPLLLLAAFFFFLPALPNHRRAASVTASLAVIWMIFSGGHALHAERNFFGVSLVREDIAQKYRFYQHGTTMHGLQSTVADEKLYPTSYYSVLYEIFTPRREAGEPIAILGQGVGTLACFGRAGQQVDLVAIDEAVSRIAANAEWFTYMRDCPATKRVMSGDARLAMRDAPTGYYGVIVADAYSSDNLPVHLLTTEAVALYMRALKEGGVVAFNISNRYLNLKPILADIADALGLVAYHKYSRFHPAERREIPATNSLGMPTARLFTDASWVIVARAEADIASTLAYGGWQKLMPTGASAWRDDFANLLQAVWAKRSEVPFAPLPDAQSHEKSPERE